jgi:hypothetical protein
VNLFSRCSSSKDSEAVLGKVSVKGKGLRDAKPFHHRKAGCISEGEILIVILGDNCFRILYISGGHPHQRCPALLHVLQKSGCDILAQTIQDERMGFGKDKAGGKEAPAFSD